MNNHEREFSLIGHFMPQKWRLMRPYIVGWKPYLCGLSEGKSPEELVWLEFDFTCLYKADIYRDLARAVINGWLQVSMIALARYLARYSNLADNADPVKRTETIYRELKEYKKKFKDNNDGTVDIAA